jgi:hypothetical protein
MLSPSFRGKGNSSDLSQGWRFRNEARNIKTQQTACDRGYHQQYFLQHLLQQPYQPILSPITLLTLLEHNHIHITTATYHRSFRPKSSHNRTQATNLAIKAPSTFPRQFNHQHEPLHSPGIRLHSRRRRHGRQCRSRTPS